MESQLSEWLPQNGSVISTLLDWNAEISAAGTTSSATVMDFEVEPQALNLNAEPSVGPFLAMFYFLRILSFIVVATCVVSL